MRFLLVHLFVSLALPAMAAPRSGDCEEEDSIKVLKPEVEKAAIEEPFNDKGWWLDPHTLQLTRNRPENTFAFVQRMRDFIDQQAAQAKASGQPFTLPEKETPTSGSMAAFIANNAKADPAEQLSIDEILQVRMQFLGHYIKSRFSPFMMLRYMSYGLEESKLRDEDGCPPVLHKNKAQKVYEEHLRIAKQELLTYARDPESLRQYGIKDADVLALQRHAVKELLVALKDLGDPTYEELAEEFIWSHFSECPSFGVCYEMMEGLVALPRTAAATIIAPEYQAQIQKQIGDLSHSLAQEIIAYYFNSITAYAMFYAFTRIDDFDTFGHYPRMEQDQLQQVLAYTGHLKQNGGLIGQKKLNQPFNPNNPDEVAGLAEKYFQPPGMVHLREQMEAELAEAQAAAEAQKPEADPSVNIDANGEPLPEASGPDEQKAADETTSDKATELDHILYNLRFHLMMRERGEELDLNQADPFGPVEERLHAMMFPYEESLESADFFNLDPKEQEAFRANLTPGQEEIFKPEIHFTLSRETLAIAMRLQDLYHNVLALELYLSVMNKRDRTGLFFTLDAAIDQGLYSDKAPFPAEVGLNALLRFGRYEYRLPSRRDWHHQLMRYVNAMDPKKHMLDVMSMVLQSDELYKLYNRQAREFAARHSSHAMFDQIDYDNELQFSLEDKEKALSALHPQYESIFKQQMQLDDYWWQIVPRYYSYADEHAPLEKGRKQEKYFEALPNFIYPFLEFNCYSHSLPHLTKNPYAPIDDLASFERMNAQKPDFQLFAQSMLAPGDQFDMTKACGYGNRSYAFTVSDYYTHKQIDDLYSRKAMEVAMQGAQIPLMLAGSTAAGMVLNPAKPTGAFIKRVSEGTGRKIALGSLGWLSARYVKQKMLRQSLRWIAYVAIREEIPKISAAFVGSAAFAATNAAALVPLGLKPWPILLSNTWKENIGHFWTHYGQEVMSGGFIFRVLPAAQTISRGMGAKWAGIGPRDPGSLKKWRYVLGPNARNLNALALQRLTLQNKLTLRQEATTSLFQIGGDTMVFTMIPYADRTVRKTLGAFGLLEADDVWQGWDQLGDDIVHAALVGMVFKAWHDKQLRTIRREFLLGGARSQLPESLKSWIGADGRPTKFYDVLGVETTASKAEIAHAYRQRAKETHPDRLGGDTSQFKQVAEAAEVLSDPALRQKYDAFYNGFTKSRDWFDDLVFMTEVTAAKVRGYKRAAAAATNGTGGGGEGALLLPGPSSSEGTKAEIEPGPQRLLPYYPD